MKSINPQEPAGRAIALALCLTAGESIAFDGFLLNWWGRAPDWKDEIVYRRIDLEPLPKHP